MSATDPRPKVVDVTNEGQFIIEWFGEQRLLPQRTFEKWVARNGFEWAVKNTIRKWDSLKVYVKAPPLVLFSLVDGEYKVEFSFEVK